MAIVHRFHTWDISTDLFRESGRWATKEAIARVHGEPIGEGVEIDEYFLGREVAGMTAVGFDARNPPTGGFQARMR
jgi:hypothetical protein